MPINIDSCKSGILTSNISDHFFVFGVFDILKINNDQNYYKIRNYSYICKSLDHQIMGLFSLIHNILQLLYQ